MWALTLQMPDSACMEPFTQKGLLVEPCAQVRAGGASRWHCVDLKMADSFLGPQQEIFFKKIP